MKIIQVSAYYPPHIGGQENSVKHISEQLSADDYAVEVFTAALGHPAEVKKEKNLIVHYLKGIEFAHTAVIPSLFNKLLQVKKTNLIHLHIAQAFVPEIVWTVSLLKNIPYVAHIHADVQSSSKYGFLLPLYKKLFLKPILQRAKKIIVPTSDYINLISKKYTLNKNNFVVIPSGVQAENFTVIRKKQDKLKRILFVGRLSKQKNVPLLIHAFSAIHRKYPYTKLTIVGDGEDRDKINKLIQRKGLSKAITLKGALQGETLYTEFKQADVFLSTSLYESFGLVLIEAMAAGLVVIAPNIAAIKNVVIHDHNGMLVDPNPQAYLEAFIKIVQNNNYAVRISKNALIDSEKYSWKSTARKLENVYTEVTTDKNHSL